MATIVAEAIEGYSLGRFQTQAEVKRFFQSLPQFPRNKHGEVKQQRVTDILTNPLYTDSTLRDLFKIRTGVTMNQMREALMEREQKLFDRKNDPKTGEIPENQNAYSPPKVCSSLPRRCSPRAWDARKAQAQEALVSAKHQIKALEKQSEALMSRIMDATNQSVIPAYEAKIADLEYKKLQLRQQVANHDTPKGTFEEKLEPALQFLANPWKLWSCGQITLQRAVLKLAFSERVAYHRKEGYRTPKTSLPFKVLESFRAGKSDLVRVKGLEPPHLKDTRT